MSDSKQKRGNGKVTDDERAKRVDRARTEHDRVLPLTKSASEHLKRATADLIEVRRIEGLAIR